MATRSISTPKLTVKLTGSVVNTLTDSTTVSSSQPDLSFAPSLSSGVSANQANRAWQTKSNTIASGAQETIDISTFEGKDIGGGAGNDALGQAMDLEEIVAIIIHNENAVTAAGQLEIVPANSQGWAPIGSHTVATGGALIGGGLLAKVNPAEAGFDVSGSSHRITLKANGGAVSYGMYILGRHDDNESSSSSSSLSSSSSSSSSSVSSQSTSSISTSSSSSSSISTSSSSISTSSSSSSISTSSESSSSLSQT